MVKNLLHHRAAQAGHGDEPTPSFGHPHTDGVKPFVRRLPSWEGVGGGSGGGWVDSVLGYHPPPTPSQEGSWQSEDRYLSPEVVEELLEIGHATSIVADIGIVKTAALKLLGVTAVRSG